MAQTAQAIRKLAHHLRAHKSQGQLQVARSVVMNPGRNGNAQSQKIDWVDPGEPCLPETSIPNGRPIPPRKDEAQ